VTSEESEENIMSDEGKQCPVRGPKKHFFLSKTSEEGEENIMSEEGEQ
jgi:hypothetical protein